MEFAISHCSAWSPAANDDDLAGGITDLETPDVSAIPAMLRRRLNLLGRACASEMLQQLPEDPATPIVYCSRHGDIERTLRVLLELGKDEPVSPKDFSLAVHNAICGVLSIHAKLTGPINAIAADGDPLIPVLLEACGLLSSSCPEVLCLLCDVPLPAVYQTPGCEPFAPYAACFRVCREGAVPVSLRQIDSDATTAVSVSALDFCRFMAKPDVAQLQIPHNRCNWEFTKQ